MDRRNWDLESVTAEARKYSGITEFKYGTPGAYKWVVRNGFESEVMGFMSEVTDPDKLMARIRRELGTAARHAKVAKDICKNRSEFYVTKEHDTETISAGSYLDFDAQMYDQGAEERSDYALEYIEQLQKFGTPDQLKEAWDLYLKYQTGTWQVRGCDAEIYMPDEEQGGSYEE